MALLAHWTLDWRLSQYREQEELTASVRLNGAQDTLNLGLGQLAALPRDLANRPSVKEYLASEALPELKGLDDAALSVRYNAYLDAPAARLIDRELRTVVEDFGLSLIALADEAGGVAALTLPRQASLTRAATSVATRDYFRDALSSGSGMQFLTGRVSKTPGLYFSHRVELEGVTLGVAVVKQDTERFNRLLGTDDGRIEFVTDDHGVVMLSSRPSLVMHRLRESRQVDDQTWQSLYQGVPPILPWQKKQLTLRGRTIDAVEIDGATYLSLSLPLGMRPFTIWHFEELEQEGAIQASTLSAAAAAWLLGLGLLWISWRRSQLLGAALQARRELLDMAQALPLTVFRYVEPRHGAPSFTFLGPGVQRLFGTDRAKFEADPLLPWRSAGGSSKPPTQAQDFKIDTGPSTLWVRADSTPQSDGQGNTIYNGYWLDITALHDTQMRLAAVFEHATNGYLFFSPISGIDRCNPAALRLFGAQSEQQLLGHLLWLPPMAPAAQADGQDSREAILVLLHQHVSSGARVQSFEWRFCRLDGTPFDTEVSVIALDEGKLTRYCAVIQDITLRKQAEAAMRQAQEAAESASRTKSSFLANMSHELRTPMNAIIGMTHLALEDGLPPQQRDYVEKAHSSAQNLLQILNDILDVSKIEAGQLQLEHIEFDIDAVVSDMSDVLGLKAEEKGLELLFTSDAELPRRVVGDPTRLRQVLVNLGNNAIKFTDSGEVTVGMEVAAQVEDQVELHVWVKDTGVGLSDEEMSRLFQPFVQADSSTTRRFGGTGLGLVICRQLVERMGGRLWVESESGRGSTFHFTARFGRSTGVARPRAWTASELRGKRALLVDDNDAALQIQGRMLSALGVEVHSVCSGEQALQRLALSTKPYTWILLDWKMPGMDGVSCARQIVARHPDEQPCILLVTAFARDQALQAAKGLRLAGVLQKPITPSSLHDCLLQARANVATAPPALHGSRAREALSPRLKQQLAGSRILLVEDHPLNQELARELLQRAGMQVVVAPNGEAALAALEAQGPFDAVLMDCQMPVMDGYTATQRLREREAWQRLPVIAMTASALAQDRERALASGMNAHITKPIDVTRMLRTLAECLLAARHAGAAEPTEANAAPDTAAMGLPLDHEATGAGPLSAPGTPDGADVIDTADGLARCLGRENLYKRVLHGFRDAEGGFESSCREALEKGRWDRALHLAHDLKGLAGTIGAHRLQALAAELHQQLPARDAPACLRLTASVGTELQAVLLRIGQLLEVR